MTDSPGPCGFGYVDCDIPEGMTIREWRARRAATRGTRRPFLPALVGAVARAWRALARPSAG